MILGFPKHQRITKEDLKPSKIEIKRIMKVSIPSTTSKIIGSISHFIEPILFTNLLLLKGYNMDLIVREYGIINGYVLPLLLVPQFFTQSISTSLVPEISKFYEENNKIMCIKRIKQILLLSLSVGFLLSIILYINPKFFLYTIYKTTSGIKYLKILSLFFIPYFIETPLSTALDSMGKNKETFIISTFSSILKLIVLSTLIMLNKGVYSLVISIIVSIITSSILYLNEAKKALKY